MAKWPRRRAGPASEAAGGYPIIDNLLTLLPANSHVYVEVAALIWSYLPKEVNRDSQRLVEAGLEDSEAGAK